MRQIFTISNILAMSKRQSREMFELIPSLQGNSMVVAEKFRHLIETVMCLRGCIFFCGIHFFLPPAPVSLLCASFAPQLLPYCISIFLFVAANVRCLCSRPFHVNQPNTWLQEDGFLCCTLCGIQLNLSHGRSFGASENSNV